MKVGILGSGAVAKSLATGFLSHGDDVMLGTRQQDRLKEWLSQHPTARVGSVDETARFGELLVLAVKGTAAPDVVRAAGATNVAGKVMLDATNPIADAPPTNGVLAFFTTLDESLMERLQREFASVQFVKAFNSVGSASMVNPAFAGGRRACSLAGGLRRARADCRHPAQSAPVQRTACRSQRS